MRHKALRGCNVYLACATKLTLTTHLLTTHILFIMRFNRPMRQSLDKCCDFRFVWIGCGCKDVRGKNESSDGLVAHFRKALLR
mmetsp:Transcript_70423/g.114428  ORF Transcript_70423/g.114428 Transcript_70423/m.114428 type:complete len:83 (-) Transcript_70423:83-331(-)